MIIEDVLPMTLPEMFNKEQVEKFNTLNTPFYYYDISLLTHTLTACTTAANKYSFHVHYALKANFDPKVLETIRSVGIGADCVSGGEVRRAVEVGFENKKIVFAGVGKS